MDLLILGGTVFLGRTLVELALARGHRVTLFNRGQSHPELFPTVEHLRGERSGDLSALADRRWQAVIDTSGYLPGDVQRAAAVLANNTPHYTFISSISVYADTSQPGSDEGAPLAQLPTGAPQTVTGETYGPFKALCEQAVQDFYGERALVIRPGLIVGPYDPTDRFSYWPWRVAQGGEVLAPGRPTRPVQFIDGRDLSGWILDLVESGRGGVFNADSPPQAITMLDVMETCRQVSGAPAEFTWVSEAFLADEGVEMWREMPLWVPESDPEYSGFFDFRVGKALAAGLRFRPLKETVADTQAWLATRPADHAWRAGISRTRERELLDRWKSQREG